MKTNAAGCAEPENACGHWRGIRQAEECDVATVDTTPKVKVNQSETSCFLGITKHHKNASSIRPAAGVLDHVRTRDKKRLANKEAAPSGAPMIIEHLSHGVS
jgi:hypothetical protein